MQAVLPVQPGLGSQGRDSGRLVEGLDALARANWPSLPPPLGMCNLAAGNAPDCVARLP